MPRFKNPLGLLSLWSGATALVLACFTVYAKSVHRDDSNITVRWLEESGLTRKNPNAISTFDPPAFMVINDGNAILALFGAGIVLSVIAIMLALLAQKRQEHSLYLSAGLICAGLAMVRINPYAGFLTIALSYAAAHVIRKSGTAGTS